MNRSFWYGFAVFFSSALLMVLEIVAGRLLAPYVGVSLYTWTSIIGVILAGLSLGNWLGGVWADRGAGERAAALTLAGAGLCSLGVLLLLTWVAPLIQGARIHLVSASFLYVLTLFFLPAVLIGVVTPLLTTLALRADPRAGHVVGRMHALAALGSILGTFITGWVLVQWLGSVRIIIATALALFLLALPFLRPGARTLPIALILAALPLAGLTASRAGFADPCEVSSSYFCIRVVEEQTPAGPTRTLVLDHLIHGTNHATEPTLLLASYAQFIDELTRQRLPPERLAQAHWFFIGGGAYTLPRAVKAAWPEAQVEVAELDPLVTHTAQQRLYVDSSHMHVTHQDARTALRHSSTTYDLVVGDAFHDIAIPYHLVTREFAAQVAAHLTPDGLYLINVVDLFPDPKLVKAMVKTLREEFAQVDVWLEQIPAEPLRLTFVISASNGAPFPPLVSAEYGMPRHWFNITEPMTSAGIAMAELPLLTDDYTPVERLISTLLTDEAGM